MVGIRSGMTMLAATAMLAAGLDTTPTKAPAYKALNYGWRGRNKYDFIPVNRSREQARRVRQAAKAAAKRRGEWPEVVTFGGSVVA